MAPEPPTIPASRSEPPLPESARSERGRPRRWDALALLAICVAVVAVGLAVQVDAERAHLHGVEGPKCWLRGALGDDACPGCGLTRSTALVLQGQWGSALDLHVGGFVVALLAVAGIPWQLDRWLGGERPVHRRLSRVAGVLLLAGVVLPWLWAWWSSAASR